MDRFVLEFERVVHLGCDVTRRGLIRELETLRFKVDRSRGSLVEAHSGSPWLPRVSTISRPVQVRLTVVGRDDATVVHVRIHDAEPIIVDAAASRAAYTTLFDRLREQLDLCLAKLDPDFRRTDPADQPSVGTNHELVDAVAGLREQGGSHSRMDQLSGLAHRAATSPALLGLAPGHTLVLRSADTEAEFDADDAELLLAVASMAADDPSLPAELAQRLGSLQLSLLQSVRDPHHHRSLELDEPSAQLVTFLHRQAAVRRALPVREQQCCNDCGQTKLVNLSLQMRERRKRAFLDALSMATSIKGGSASSFAIVSRLLGAHASAAPMFTCSRCQGASVETTLATICPHCRAIRTDPVLSTCTAEGCGYDFLAGVATLTPWHVVEPPCGAPASGPALDVASSEPGWYPDPVGRHEWRWFEGVWGPQVCDRGVVAVDGLFGHETCAAGSRPGHASFVGADSHLESSTLKGRYVSTARGQS